jgi:hypothetical protein
MKSRAICILGMHRSGTSLISRAINLIGVDLGKEEELIAPDENNLTGYWEHVDIVDLHERMLGQLKQTWHTIVCLPEKWHIKDEIKPFRDELIELINKNFSDRQLWAWKDPRTSILMPIWKDVLNEMGIELSIIFMIRNPFDVAKSLKKRDGFSYDKSFGIWFNQNLAALQTIFDLPHIFIHYDAVLSNWEYELKRCATALGINWPENNIQIKEKMNEFLRFDLRHSFSEMMELKAANAPDFVIELYELLKGMSGVSSTVDEEFITKIKDFSFRFSSYTRFYKHDSEQLQMLEQLLSEKTQMLIEKDMRIQAFLNSRSWKITKPLRALYGIIKKGR